MMQRETEREKDIQRVRSDIYIESDPSPVFIRGFGISLVPPPSLTRAPQVVEHTVRHHFIIENLSYLQDVQKNHRSLPMLCSAMKHLQRGIAFSQ